jgi:cell division protein FtsB
MKQQKDNRILKVLVGLFLVGLIGLGVWSYSTYQENEKIKTALADEKAEIEKELENISNEYTAEIEKGNVMSADLAFAKDRIERLVDSVGNLKSDVRVLASLRRELNTIRQERKSLQDRISILEKDNQNLARVNDSTVAVLNEELIKGQDRDSTITKLSENMAKASSLLPTNFSSKGLIIRSSGKQIENDRASRLDDIQVCFTLPENPLAEKGVTSFYLQVINPDNNVLGANAIKNFEGQELKYSKVVNFNYKGKELDICELVNANEDNIISGRYRVNLYNGSLLVGSSEMTFK